ncbi:hypothetical protein [Candidatus Magnetaquicoccus inordinatus]|uniref:hypothetical protein n=1 Tax=Candidatus Magnetaquicoccus inordinatus TaxID=2496818 RepID=UPI00102CB6E7|nr:hypothetical protein [Candidatus Magnetaquicoccus inordinatus]
MLPGSGLHIDQAPPLSVPFRFFATAPFFLLLCGLVLLQEGGSLLSAPLLPETVALVHLITLGWIATVMFGAMYQMIPVLGGGPVPWVKGSRWVHGMLIVGVLSLVLEVGIGLHRWLLLLASFSLAGAVILFIIPVGLTLFRAHVVHPTLWAMRLAILNLLAVLIMGLIFLGEYAHGFLAIDRHAMIGVHLIWGLFGWVATLMIGVSFHVLPMFYMMPPFPRERAYTILIGLAVTWVLLPTAMLLWDPLPFWAAWLAASPALAALLLYGKIMLELFQQRRRKKWDVTLRLWQVGYLGGSLAVLVMWMWPLFSADRLRYLFAVLFLFGFVSSIIMGMLYRIIPFLTWFHRYSSRAGQPGVPMMEDLTPPSGQWQLRNQWAGLVLFVAAMLSGWDPLLRLAGVSLIVAALLLWYLLYFALRNREATT